MEISGIKYIAPMFDNSGYAQAARGYIMSLHKLGIPLTLAPISFEKARPDLGDDCQFMYDLVEKDIDYNVVIIHTTPEFWGRFKEPGRVNIGYTLWETTKLHPSWPVYINQVDKVLCGTDWNKKMFAKCGVTIPIGVVPHGISLKEFENVKPYNLAGLNEDTFVFYSIFQWQERKNPAALLKAYWAAFQNNENVALVLKTYRWNYSDEEKNAIRTEITNLKKSITFDKYPPIFYISDMLTRDEILGLHARGDCYASLDRGEGFGLGGLEAGAIGNPLLITGFGGVTQYATEFNSYLVDCSLTPVAGMPWSPWYRGDQFWAEPDVFNGICKMQMIYEDRDRAKNRGLLLQENIRNNFSWEVVGNKMVEEIKAIL